MPWPFPEEADDDDNVEFDKPNRALGITDIPDWDKNEESTMSHGSGMNKK